MFRLSSLAATCVVVASQVFSGVAEAAPFYGFKVIPSSDSTAGDALIGETQLFVELLNLGASQVGFRFTNVGPLASSITQIYFDDGSLLGIAGLDESHPGVDYNIDPPGSENLPRGNNIDFNTTAGFWVAPAPPTQPNGVNPGEFLTVIFDLIAGQDFQDVIDAIELGLANPGEDVVGGLRIGIHVQGYTSGGSESFVNGPPEETPPPEIPGIPEPGSMTLLALGSIGLGGFLRRKMKKEVIAA